MTRKWACLAMSFTLMALFACAPKPASVPTTPTPQPPAPSPASPVTSNISTPMSQDAAWSRVVEAAKKEGSVTVYAVTIIGDTGQAVADAFYKRYGIRVDIIAGPGSVLSEKIRTEQRMNQVIADVAAELSAAFAVVLLQEGHLTPLVKELPVLREDAWLVPPAMDDGGNIIRGFPSFHSPWINTDLVKPEEMPKSWPDLLDPRWKGKLLIMDPRTVAAPDRAIYTLTKYKIVEPNFFPRLVVQNLSIPAGVGMGPPFTALAKGEGAVLIFGVDSQGGPVLKAGGHIRPTVLAGSVVGTSGAIQLIKNAPHPNAGKLFINFLLSQQGYELVTTIAQLGSLRKDVADRSVLASLKPFNVIANTIEEEIQISKNNREGVAAKVLGVQ